MRLAAGRSLDWAPRRCLRTVASPDYRSSGTERALVSVCPSTARFAVCIRHTAVLDYHHGHIRFSGCLLVDTGWCAILLPVLRIVRDPQLRIETVLQLAKAPNGLHALHVL